MKACACFTSPCSNKNGRATRFSCQQGQLSLITTRQTTDSAKSMSTVPPNPALSWAQLPCKTHKQLLLQQLVAFLQRMALGEPAVLVPQNKRLNSPVTETFCLPLFSVSGEVYLQPSFFGFFFCTRLWFLILCFPQKMLCIPETLDYGHYRTDLNKTGCTQSK